MDNGYITFLEKTTLKMNLWLGLIQGLKLF
jgi:hypothetical protein